MQKYWIAAVVCLLSSEALAQSFGTASETRAAPAVVSTPAAPAQNTGIRLSDIQKTEPEKAKPSDDINTVIQNRYKKEEPKEGDEEEFFMPKDSLAQLKTPTLDGSVRGTSALQMIEKVNKRDPNQPEIFLFFDRFKIGRSLGGQTSCDVRFIVLTALDKRLISLDVKLVWPLMTTALSFNNVMPNTMTYINYTLLGNGCYDMDKIPNIIVNRCRIKGESSVKCAGKITWIKPESAARGR